MKIDRITLYHIRMDLVSPFENAAGQITTRDGIIVEALSEGLAGYGECPAFRDPYYTAETSRTAWHILRDYLAPAVLGQNLATPLDFPPLVSRVRGHPMAKAGLELALWDLQGQREGRSLQQLLGGAGRKVAVGVAVGLQPSRPALLDAIAGYLAEGYGRVKMKIKPGRDVAEVEAVRRAFPNLPLQVDANSAYTLETAAALHALDDLGLLLIEQPLAEDDLWEHSLLQRRLATPLCLDESINSLHQARQALALGACRVLTIKPARIGGLSQALAVHDLCQAQGVPVWCGGMLETGVGRAANLALASLPNFTLPGDISASERYYHQDITEQRFVLNPDSTIDAPTAPGLGVDIDHQALERVALARLRLP